MGIRGGGGEGGGVSTDITHLEFNRIHVGSMKFITPDAVPPVHLHLQGN
jgi:hypothetical protein